MSATGVHHLGPASERRGARRWRAVAVALLLGLATRPAAAEAPPMEAGAPSALRATRQAGDPASGASRLPPPAGELAAGALHLPPRQTVDLAAGPLHLPPRLTDPARSSPGLTGPATWRAIAEEAIALGIGGAGYAATRLPAPDARPVPLLDKVLLRPGAWGLDADSRGLNYVGHPVDGWVFYSIARSNRLGPGTSLGMTLASGWAWELIEYRELLSAHDVVTTAAGGFALGESLHQLSAWLGQRPGWPARAGSVLLDPFGAFHGQLDGAPREAGRFGAADVAAWITAGTRSTQPGDAAGELRLGARARLVRAGLDAPWAGWRPLLDGNVTEVAVELAVGRAGLTGVEVLSTASLAGFFAYHHGDAGEGLDLLATAGFGFDYLRSPVAVAGGWVSDDLALVRTPGVELVAALRRDALRAELGLEAAVTLGGVDPLALQGGPTAIPGAPGVLRLSGYYHALGWMLAPRAALVAGDLELSASWRLDGFGALAAPDVSPPPDGGDLALEDAREALRAGFAWRLPIGGLALVGRWERIDRWGRAGVATASRRTTWASLGLAMGTSGGP